MTDREGLRRTFDSAADLYHAARPRYPAELFDALARFAAPHDGAVAAPLQALEIGPATGVATEQLAGHGWEITAVELGAELAATATDNLARFENVSVVHASFDDWVPPAWPAFDLVVAATAWHWLDPASKHERAHRHLRPGGTLAFWSALHVVPDGGDPFFAEIQDVYDEIGESLPGDHVFPRPGELPTHSDELEASGLFTDITIKHFDWEIVYDADAYLNLLDTFSGHIAMAPNKRRHLYSEIRTRLAQREDAQLRRHWGAALHLAQAT